MFVQIAYDVVDRGGQSNVVYTIFAKAFDQLDHGLLLCKFSVLGFSEGMLSLLFLRGPTLCLFCFYA